MPFVAAHSCILRSAHSGPIYDFQSDNAMAFRPPYWKYGVRNSSSGYNYYQWNKQNRGPSVVKVTRKIRGRYRERPKRLSSEVELIIDFGLESPAMDTSLRDKRSQFVPQFLPQILHDLINGVLIEVPVVGTSAPCADPHRYGDRHKTIVHMLDVLPILIA
jgi:hypothetical protein